MRILIAFCLALVATPVSAQSVAVSVGRDLADMADEYGQRDVDRLVQRLDDLAEAALVHSGRYPGARMELVLEDAAPNRPTFEQMASTPGLSMESLSLGGARISGQIIAADGTVTAVAYRWYETNIFASTAAGTWSDAERAMRRFARRLGDGAY